MFNVYYLCKIDLYELSVCRYVRLKALNVLNPVSTPPICVELVLQLKIFWRKNFGRWRPGWFNSMETQGCILLNYFISRHVYSTITTKVPNQMLNPDQVMRMWKRKVLNRLNTNLLNVSFMMVALDQFSLQLQTALSQSECFKTTEGI